MRMIATAAVLAALLVSACDDDDPTDIDDDVRTVTLAAVGGFGISGTATITDDPGNTSTVQVILSGLTAGNNHPGHVHVTSCATGGGIVQNLTAMTPTQATDTAVTAGVPDSLLTNAYYLQYHMPTGAAMACGDIP